MAETEDLSPRGIYVRTDVHMPVGEETDLRVTLPSGQTIALYARVAHVLTPAAAHALGRHPGIGFELLGPDTPARLQLRAFLDTLKAEVTNQGLTTTTQVIVVEPSPPLRTRMARALEAAGFKVTAVATAMEALSACTVWRPDTIIAASEMDGMTGVDLMYAMSDHPTLADVPLILTGGDSDLHRLEAFRAGVRDYIPRPFLDEELLIRVHRVAAPVISAAPGLRGSLHDIALGTLLSLFEFERKSGVLSLMRQGETSRLFLADGRILKLDAPGPGSAKTRIMKLLDWRDGQFEFAPTAVTGKDEVNIPVTALLLEHARRSDEAKATHQVVPAQLSSAAIGIPMDSSMFALPATDKDQFFESWSGVIPMGPGTNPGIAVPTLNPGTNPGMAVNPATATPPTPTPVVPAPVAPVPTQTAPMPAQAPPSQATPPPAQSPTRAGSITGGWSDVEEPRAALSPAQPPKPAAAPPTATAAPAPKARPSSKPVTPSSVGIGTVATGSIGSSPAVELPAVASPAASRPVASPVKAPPSKPVVSSPLPSVPRAAAPTPSAPAPLPPIITKLPSEPSMLTLPTSAATPPGGSAIVEETVIMNAAPSGMGEDTMEDWDDDVQPLDSSGMMPLDASELIEEQEPDARPSQPPSLPPPPPTKPQASVPPQPPKKLKAQ